MSAAHHESAAAAHESESSQHAAMYDPSAHAERERCSISRAETSLDVCWTSITNPTDVHLREAEAQILYDPIFPADPFAR